MSRFGIINILFLLAAVACTAAVILLPISVWWLIALIFIYLSILFYGVVTPSAGFFIPVKWRGSLDSDAIAITFDDGPQAGHTDSVMEVLGRHNVQAAFFCIGNNILKNPELARQLHEAGHIVSNHSFTHSSTFDLQSAGTMEEELRRTDVAVSNLLGVTPRLFRPPYGVLNPNLAKAIRRRNYVTVGWSVRSFDTMINDKHKLMKRVTRKLKGGDIVLFHDRCAATVEILPEFIAHVRNIGLKIVRLDTLLNEKAYV